MRMNLGPKDEIHAALLSYRRLFLVIAVFGGVINLLMIVPSLYMMQVYDRVLNSRNEVTLLMLTLITLGMYLLSGLLEWTRGQIMIRMSAGLDLRLADRVFDAAFQRSLREHDANPAQVIADLGTVRQFVTGQGLIALLDAPWFPLFLAAAFLFHPWFGLFALAGAVILFSLAVFNELATRVQLSEANRQSVRSSQYVNSVLQNAEVIQAMGMLDALRRRWGVLQRGVILAQAQASDRSARITAASRFVKMAWQSLSLGLGALLVLKGEISPGMMIAMSVLLGRALSPVELAIASWKQFGGAKSAYQRLKLLLELHPQAEARMPLPPPTGHLRADNLLVVPPGAQRAAVSGVSLELARGEVLAIIGPSASGKSSLVRALVGVWPAQRGCVRLDEADVQQWPRGALGPYLGYLPQDVELFDGTVSENIARFGEVDPAAVIAAATLAGIHEMVLHFPDGYDTRLGPGGLGLSGGQRQRIGLARAVYGNPALIVLDEPNSNLDAAGEAALVAAVGTLKAAGSTLVLVTHRTSLLGVVDKLLILRDGLQQAFGPKAEVLKAIADASAAANVDRQVEPQQVGS